MQCFVSYCKFLFQNPTGKVTNICTVHMHLILLHVLYEPEQGSNSIWEM